MQIPAPPKGTRDFYPEDMRFQDYIFSSWEKTCRRYGFEKFDAPLFEHLEVYTHKSGDEIEKQLYTFEDKAGRRLALRPEMTPSLARMVAAKGSSLKTPIRWYSIPRLFRYEKMQKGRLREFFQLNMDILGIAHVMADAELIAASIDIMRDLGLTSTDFTVHVSSRNLLEELFLGAGLQKESLPLLYALLDRRHKMPPGEFMEQLTQTVPLQSVRDTINAVLQMKSFDEIRAINSNAQSVKELSSLFELMDAYGMKEYVAFDIGIVRGLAYYTGIVFELLDKNRDLRAIAGGGRYDKLVSLYGGPDTPAAGFAIGDVVLAELLTAKGVIPDYTVPRSTVFIVSLCQDTAAGSIALAQLLRSNGISCEFALKPQNISKQMKGADAARSQIVIFTGGDEEKQGMVKIKIMRTGEEKLVFKDTIVQNVKECIAI